MDRLRLLLVASLATAGCSSPNAVLLTVSADAKVEQYDLYVHDSTNKEVLHTGFNPVQLPGEAPRDLTKQGLKIALKMDKGGRYTLLMVGVIGDVENGKPAQGSTQLFWAGRLDINGIADVSARLLTVMDGDDLDRDLWPDATNFLAHNSMAPAQYGGHLDLLDCDDDPTSMPVDKDGKPIKYKAEDINPFATEVCGDGYDENCSGMGDEPCVDNDKDGDPSVTDCDDNDPKRHHPTAADPFPDPPNCCGYNLGKKGTPDEFKDFTGDPVLCPKPRCGDKIDEGCNGKDTTCIIDADCDGDPAKPVGNDCDDSDPTVHSGALEPCGSTKDLNCDGVVNGGCVPCDLDGDGFERDDKPNGCPDNKDKNPGKFDCNDYDAAVFPGSTTNCGGNEAGTAAIGRLTCSLRQFCRHVYEPTGAVVDGTQKISSFGWLVGDMDCNGTAYEGCPPASCDQDGDGWPVNDGVCAAIDGKFDCDDTNPTIYPGAPVSCGSGAAENCTDQKQPCDMDADHDGWNAGPDCDDGDPTRHPWALELCDGKDNDCDGLIDEGNPDTAGKPMVSSGAVTSCTDNNVGECGKTRGVCVCAIALPMSTINSADRISCPTEDAGGAKPPHCFGAGQPHPQTCDHDNPKDDDCNGAVDDPGGVNLAVKGMPCGINGPPPLGQCKQGVIVGCDSSQTNCFAKYMRVPASQSWYVCSSDTICPVDELCNGLDDDCDGLLAGNQAANPPLSMIPANDEIDHDADGYLACTTCAGLTLPMSVAGCGDCDDANNKRHPNHSEDCDNLDNSCNPAWSASPPGTDGKDQCSGGTTCCSTQTVCRNLSTDNLNCGQCGVACVIPKKSTGCAGGACVCNKVAGCDPSITSGVYCDPSAGGGNGACVTCSNNTYCGDGCDPCGAGQQCQADAMRPGHYTCGCTDDCGCTNPAQRYCNKASGNCQATAPNGHNCGASGSICGVSQAVTCATGNCVDGYCCNSGCGSPCAACNVSGSEGTCTPVTGSSPVGGRSCTGGGVAPCGGYCNGSTSCFYPPNSTMCTPNLACSGNTLQQQSYCNGAGLCTAGASGPCAGNVICATSTTCKPMACGGDGDCATGYWCNAPTCTLKATQGMGCSAGNQCGTGNCVDGACCTSSTCPQCRNCKLGSVISGGGTCVNVVTSMDDTTGTTCATATDTKSCDSGGNCKGTDGLVCTGGGDCVNGNCYSNGVTGSPLNCCNVACTGGCVLSTNCTGGSCDVAAPGTTCGGKYLCDGVSPGCTNSCSNDNQCSAGNWCFGGACIGCDTGASQCGSGQRCQNLCGSGRWCSSSTCTACSSGSSPCGSGQACENLCGTDRWCSAGSCSSCSSGSGPCGASQSCQSFCTAGNNNGRYCNGGTCANCSNSDDAHCGTMCSNCGSTADTPHCSSGSCACTSDGDCSAANKYCASTSPASCQTRIQRGMGCAAGNCAAAAPGCQQCGPMATPSPCPGSQC
jgi:hypothetical protein